MRQTIFNSKNKNVKSVICVTDCVDWSYMEISVNCAAGVNQNYHQGFLGYASELASSSASSRSFNLRSMTIFVPSSPESAIISSSAAEFLEDALRHRLLARRRP